jgi:hypothetical protein
LNDLSTTTSKNEITWYLALPTAIQFE